MSAAVISTFFFIRVKRPEHYWENQANMLWCLLGVACVVDDDSTAHFKAAPLLLTMWFLCLFLS